MPRIIRSLVTLPVLVAIGVLVTGCGSSSTGPQTTPSAYAGSYSGIVEGAGGSGTVAITVGQVSADLTRGPGLHAEGGNPDAVTVTLATATGSITLTGTISGNTAMVTSTTPPATCTITFTTTGASGSCTEAPYGTLSLLAFVLVNGIEPPTVYCGTQSPGLSPAFFPSATLGAVVSGPNMYLIVAPPTGMPTLYSGTIASNSVSLTSTSSGAVYSGTVTGTAGIGGTITSGGSGSWAVSNPCVQGVLTVSTNAVPVSASVGSTTTITPTPVTITNGGSSGSTLGVLGVGAATYSPSATSGWLQASLTSPTTMSGTLSLSVTPPSGIAAGTYMASVPVTSSLGTGSPQTVTVTLTIASGVTITSTSPLPAWVDLIPFSDQLTASGGSGTYTWSLASGSTLPAWLTLTSGGLVTGTAPAGVSYPASAPLTFSVTATDGTTSSTKQLQITVYLNVTIASTSPLPVANFGVPYSYQFTATGGPTSSYGWSLGLGSGLPGWLSLSTSGILSGTPPVGAATPVTFTVVVTSGGSTASLPVSLPITANTGPLTITSPFSLPAYFTTPFGGSSGYQLAAVGGPSPSYVWSVASGSSLPGWLSLSSAGVLSGTPPVGAATSASFHIMVTSGVAPNQSTATGTFMVTIYPVLQFSPASLTFPQTLGGAQQPAPENVVFTGIGGQVTGLTVHSITYGAGGTGWLAGAFTGTPVGTTPGALVVQPEASTVDGLPIGTYTATITVSSSTPGALGTAVIAVTLDVTASTPVCTITTSPTLPTLTDGTVADVLLTTTGPCPTTGSDTWTVTPGSLPAGLTIPLGGTLPQIYGTPTTSGAYSGFTVNLVNSVAGTVASEAFNGGTVLAATVCEIGPNPEPNGTVGVLYAQGFVASNNCTSPSDDKSLWSWGITAGAPPGLTFDNPIVGVKDVGLTGTPTQAGTFTFTVTFTNANQVGGHNEASATQAYSMIIAPAPSGTRVRAAPTHAGSQ